MFQDQTIAFIGSGTMAEAMIRGLIDQGVVQPERILAAGPSERRGTELKDRHGIRTTTYNAEAAEAGQVVVLSVKPQVLTHVLPELHGRLQPEDLLLSIVAGAPIKRLAGGTGHSAIARAMPNTPAQIGMGITVWTGTEAVDSTRHDQASAVFGALGEEVHVDDERYLDMATALSGSGPSYVFLLMEAMIDAGVHMGFPRRIAERLVEQTIAGSVEYARQSGKHVAELRNQVTSPGGTSAAALYRMEKGGMRTIISRGIWAAYERSVALGRDEGPEQPKGD